MRLLKTELDPLLGQEPDETESHYYGEDGELYLTHFRGSAIRLINTTTLEMKKFQTHVPQYAILSHTWGDDEVTFQEWPTLNSFITRKSGYKKIVNSCEMARQHSFKWLWADTCCIDKTSSAELAEAINSMFAWYAASSICFAYLSDVQSTVNGYDAEAFRLSRWFTRGWTLQELLAPQSVAFYDPSWKLIGKKDGSGTASNGNVGGLSSEIAEITGIKEDYITRHQSLGHGCVAEKMSWLSRRTTTRQEDIAYCALGIFDVNMPLLYGEGKKAFLRLQEEIIRNSHDQTIFCWTPNHDVPRTWISLLAPSPSVFHLSDKIVPYAQLQRPESYQLTNMGLTMMVNILRAPCQTYLAVLGVARISDDGQRKVCCIPVRQISAIGGGKTFRSFFTMRMASRISPYFLHEDDMMNIGQARLHFQHKSVLEPRLSPHPDYITLKPQFGITLLSDAFAPNGPVDLNTFKEEHSHVSEHHRSFGVRRFRGKNAIGDWNEDTNLFVLREQVPQNGTPPFFVGVLAFTTEELQCFEPDFLFFAVEREGGNDGGLKWYCAYITATHFPNSVWKSNRNFSTTDSDGVFSVNWETKITTQLLATYAEHREIPGPCASGNCGDLRIQSHIPLYIGGEVETLRPLPGAKIRTAFINLPNVAKFHAKTWTLGDIRGC